MNCKEAEKQVQPFIEGKLSDKMTESFIVHVQSCPSCYDELETYFTIYYALKYVDDSPNRSYDMQKVLKEELKRREHEIRQRHIFKAVFMIGSIAAEAIITVFAVFHYFPFENSAFLSQFLNLLGFH